jgi:MFS transporter, VNT family, synaptic vesicle glycoprotein 2
MAFGMVYLPALAWLVVPFRTHLEFDLAFIGMRFTVWRLFIVLCALMNVVTLVGIFKLPESGKFLLSKGEHNRAVEVLEEVHRRNKSEDPIVSKLALKIYFTTRFHHFLFHRTFTTQI